MILSGGRIASQRSRWTKEIFAGKHLSLLAVLWCSACGGQLPPARTPSAEVPQVEATAHTGDGESRLVIDVVDGPTPVKQIHMRPEPIQDAQGQTRYEFVESWKVLCETTPCAVNLPRGNILLGFPVLGNPREMEVELVHLEAEPTVYRRALTFHDPEDTGTRTLGIVGASLGGMTMTAGAAMLPIGLVRNINGLTIAGSISLGVGTVVTALGVWGIVASSSTYRPGSAIHFSF